MTENKTDADARLAGELYDTQAEKYNAHQDAHAGTQDLRKRVHALLGAVKGKRVLYAGCGAGGECEAAISQGARVTGVDASAKSIELAKGRFPNATFVAADMEQVPFGDDSFDAVVSILGIMYKSDLVPVLSEFGRVLAPGGAVIIAVPHPIKKMMRENKLDYFVRGKQWVQWESGHRLFNYGRTIEDYVDAFCKGGFVLAKLAETPPIGDKPFEGMPTNYPQYLIFRLVRGPQK